MNIILISSIIQLNMTACFSRVMANLVIYVHVYAVNAVYWYSNEGLS